MYDLNILFIGDIVGRPGRRTVRNILSKLIFKHNINFVIANGENAAGGAGLTKKVAEELFDIGIDCLTLGNHTWDNKEIFKFINNEERIVRPANYPLETPGNGFAVLEKGNIKLGIMNLLGRVFMNPLNCPFKAAEQILEELKDIVDIIIVDFHAEATSEKMAMGWFLDGKVTAVLGTHTHIQTADDRILPGGTGYITDVGMTGPYNSILGVQPELVIKKFITQLPVSFKVASGESIFNGVLLKIDEKSKKVNEIKRINIQVNTGIDEKQRNI